MNNLTSVGYFHISYKIGKVFNLVMAPPFKMSKFEKSVERALRRADISYILNMQSKILCFPSTREDLLKYTPDFITGLVQKDKVVLLEPHGVFIKDHSEFARRLYNYKQSPKSDNFNLITITQTRIDDFNSLLSKYNKIKSWTEICDDLWEEPISFFPTRNTEELKEHT